MSNAEISAGFSASFSYVATVVDPCATATFTQPASYTLGTNIVLSTALGTAKSLAFSLAYLFETSSTGCALTSSLTTPTGASFITGTVDSALTVTISVSSSTSNANVGLYTTTLNSCITARSTACKSEQFVVKIVIPCSETTVYSSSLQNQSRVVWQSGISYQFVAFTDSDSDSAGNSNLCPKTYSFTYTPSVSVGVTLPFSMPNTATGAFYISSDNMNQIGTYVVTVTAKVTAYPTQTTSTQFNIVITDPCLATTLSVPSTALSQMTTSVLLQNSIGQLVKKSQIVSVFSDSVSVDYGNGVDICGAKTYQISSVPTAPAITLSSSELQINAVTRLISLYSTNKFNVGTHTATVSVSLANYASVPTATQTFLITIEPCIITSFTTTNPQDKSYTITEAQFPWSVDTTLLVTQVPACGYSYTVTPSNVPTFVTQAGTGTTVDFSAYGVLRSQIGTYIISLKLDITEYTYSPIPSTTATQTFIAKDPCYNTEVSGLVFSWPTPTVKNFFQFAGYNLTSNESFKINDTISQSFTQLTDSVDFCGVKTFSYQISNQTTTMLSGKNNQSITFSPPSAYSDYGTLPAIIIGCLKEYPTVACKQTYFNVTVLGSIVPIMPNLIYTIGNPILTIKVGNFEILPLNQIFDTPLEIYFRAYILAKGATISSPIDLASKDLTFISNQSWIKYNNLTNSFEIFTDNSSFTGIYTIVVVQSFAQPTGVYPFTSFNILLFKPEPNYIVTPKPPYFSSPPQDQSINQCPNENPPLWSYSIPQPKDHYNSTVRISVDSNTQFSQTFNFNGQNNVISQKNIADKPLNTTVKIILTNQVDLSQTYSFLVYFKCTPKPVAVQNSFLGGLSKKGEKLVDVWNQKQWPTAFISKISPTGLMTIQFNQRMKVPNVTVLSEIQNGNVTINSTVRPNMQVQVAQGKLSDSKQLDFNWKLANFTNTELLIQIDFKNPVFVSSQTDYPDQIFVEIFAIQYFIDDFQNYMYPGTKLDKKNIPKQVSQKSFQTAVKTSSNLQSVVQTAIFSNFAVALLVSGPLQEILGSIRSLQIILHTMLLKLAFPAATNVYFGMLMNVLTFQVYDFTNIFTTALSLDNNGRQAFSDQFEAMGYSTYYVVLNFGTLCLTIFFVPLMWMTTKLLVRFFKLRLESQLQNWQKYMFYNSWIQLLNETYLFLGTCCALNFYYFYFNSYGNVINSLIASTCGVAIVAFPFFVLYFYSKEQNVKKIQNYNEEFSQRFGSVLEGLKVRGVGRFYLVYPVASLLRKLFLIYVAVYMQNYPVFSMFAINFSTQIMVMILGYVPPFQKNIANHLEIMNEVLLLLTNYHLMMFTDFLSDTMIKEDVGMSLVVVTIFGVVLNLSIIIIETVSILLRIAKLSYLKWQQSKTLQACRQQTEAKLKQLQAEKNRQEQLIKQAELDAVMKYRAKQKQHYEEIQRQSAILRQEQENQRRIEQFKQELIGNQNRPLTFEELHADMRNGPRKYLVRDGLIIDIPATKLNQNKARELIKFNENNASILSLMDLAVYRTIQQQQPEQKQQKITSISQPMKTNKEWKEERNQERISKNQQIIEAKMKQNNKVQNAKIQSWTSSVLANEIFNREKFGYLNLNDYHLQFIREVFDKSEQNPQVSLFEVENQLRDYLPPDALLDRKIMQQFGQSGKKIRFMQKEGLDNYIMNQIESGNFSRVLSEYQEKRRKIYLEYRDADESAKSQPISYGDFNFGDWSADMSLHEQGQLFYQIESHKQRKLDELQIGKYENQLIWYH